MIRIGAGVRAGRITIMDMAASIRVLLFTIRGGRTIPGIIRDIIRTTGDHPMDIQIHRSISETENGQTDRPVSTLLGPTGRVLFNHRQHQTLLLHQLPERGKRHRSATLHLRRETEGRRMKFHGGKDKRVNVPGHRPGK